MAARAEDNKAAFLKYISNKRNPNNGLGPLLGEDGKIVNTAAEKADVLNKYLRFYICIEARLCTCIVQSISPEDVKQHLLVINIFNSVGLDNFQKTSRRVEECANIQKGQVR